MTADVMVGASPEQAGYEHTVPWRAAGPSEGCPISAQTSPAYAIAMLHDVRVTDELLAYMEAVEQTLQPFGGHWISHGRTPELLEGVAEGYTSLSTVESLRAAVSA